jgi:hypothetical protein
MSVVSRNGDFQHVFKWSCQKFVNVRIQTGLNIQMSNARGMEDNKCLQNWHCHQIGNRSFVFRIQYDITKPMRSSLYSYLCFWCLWSWRSKRINLEPFLNQTDRIFVVAVCYFLFEIEFFKIWCLISIFLKLILGCNKVVSEWNFYCGV